jgi:hypothetical protein
LKKTDSVDFPLSWRWLVSVRTRALRCGVWYSALSKGERGCMDLAIRVVERIRSRLLRRVLSAVVAKLAEALESPVRRLMRDVGSGLALRLSRIAASWGNRQAATWTQNVGFVRYLAVMHLNAVGPP